MPKGTRPLPSMAPADDGASEKRRMEQLATLLDHCTAAQVIADAQGNRFLSYMLAMTIEAAQGAMHPRH